MYKTLEQAAQEVSALEYAARSVNDLRAKRVILRIANEKAHQAYRIAHENLDLVRNDMYAIRHEIQTSEKEQSVEARCYNPETIKIRIAARGIMSSDPTN